VGGDAVSEQSDKLRDLADAMDALDAMTFWRERCGYKDMAGENGVAITWSVGSALPGYADIRQGVRDILRNRLLNGLIDDAIRNQAQVVQDLRNELFGE